MNQIRVSGIDVEWHPERGTCTFEKLPVAMMWVDTTLAGLMAGVQAMVGTERFALALQSEGRKSVEADWQVIARYPDFHEGFKAIANIAAVAGWGRWELVSLDAERRECRFRVADSWEGRYQKALGVCWGSGMLAGKLAGYCSRLFGTNCWADQTAFVAAGDPHDEFAVAPSARSIEQEIGSLLASDAATRADMAAALQALEREVAERTRAEAALRQSQSLLQSTFRAAPVGIGVVSGRILQWSNERLCEMTGYAASELAGRSARMLYPSQEEFDYVGREKYAQISARGTGTVETRWQRKDGCVIDVLLSSTPLDPANLEAGVVFTALDITERRRAERALRESEERFRTLANQAPIMIGATDEAGNITFLNKTWLDFRGKSLEEEAGWAWADGLHPEDRDRVLAEMQSAIEQREPYSIEYRIQDRAGDYHWVLDTAAPQSDPDGRPRGYIGTALDITDRKRAEAERLDMERRLLHAQKLESLGILAGGIAHDFNNLLMAILGNLDVTLLDLSPLSPARAGIEQAMKAARRATDLTRQMLAYSGRGHLVVTRVDLGDLVRENADLFRTAIPRTVSMSLFLTPEPALTEADPGQVQQVVMNLITNAAEAFEDRPGTITLTTGVQQCDEAYLGRSRLEEKPPAGRFVFLEVSDTGGGMDERARQRLFDPFFTTKFTGRGLGMSAVLGIVRSHEGAILVESAVGRGTTIRVLFPAYRERAAATATSSATSSAATAVAPGPSPATGMILVADDEEPIRALCVSFVERLGFTALTAADGEEALALFERHADALVCVLLDLTMPRLDGVQAFRRMKRLRPGIPVILSSGYGEQDAMRRFTAEGLAGFIQKPYRLQELEAALARALRRPG